MTNYICEGDGHILMLPLYQIILYAPDTRHTYLPESSQFGPPGGAGQ